MAPAMTEADIKIAAYTDAMDICDAQAKRYGDLPGVACKTIKAALQDRIREIVHLQIHDLAVGELG